MPYNIYRKRPISDEVVRENVLLSDALELLKTYMPDPDFSTKTRRVGWVNGIFKEYYIATEPDEDLPF